MEITKRWKKRGLEELRDGGRGRGITEQERSVGGSNEERKRAEERNNEEEREGEKLEQGRKECEGGRMKKERERGTRG